MKIEKHTNTPERQILTAMVTQTAVLCQITPAWPPHGGLFAAKYANLVGGWCVKHYRAHGVAPHNHIEGYYEDWSEKADPDTAALVADFLAGLDGEYQRNGDANAPHIIARAADYFRRVAVRQHAQGLLDELETADYEAADHRLATFVPPLINGQALGPLMARGAILNAFASRTEPLITYPGALGAFFGRSFERDGFIAFQAPEKRGKTAWLIDVAWQALLARRRVAFFQVGDLSEAQLLERLSVRAARRPLAACNIQWPTALSRGQDKKLCVSHEVRACPALTGPVAAAAWEKVLAKQVKTKGNDYFYGRVGIAGTVSVADIKTTLVNAARGGWVADMVVIDYADLLAPPPGLRERRDQINATWIELRALSQELHCLVITATQAKAAAYTSGLQGMEHFSEDKRKLAHVTGLIGINNAPKGSDLAGVQRLNWIVRRSDSVGNVVNVAGCFALWCPAVRSCF